MQLAKYLKHRKLTARDVANWCRPVSIGVVYRWLGGKSIPRPDHVKRIASRTDYEVTADDFYGLTEKRQAAHRRARAQAGTS